MRIVIDLEAAQSPQSRNRGIGRYSIALAKAMLRQGTRHDFTIALNGMYADTVASVREEFADLIAPQDIVTWHATMPPLAPRDEAQRRACELVRFSFLASLRADIVHVASLFESGPWSFTSIGQDTDGFRTAVTLYDLIPHVYRDIYLYHPDAAREYDRKIENLRRADLWLAISESSRREGIERLALPDGRVVNISSAADPHFTPGEVSAEAEGSLRGQYGLLRPFVMYTGGIDHRKNIEGLIQAWAALPRALRDAHQLAVVCSVQPPDRARLEALATKAGLQPGDVVLTGFVPEEHLVTLYRLCKLFVFPSKHEGFGLPALEAMSCGAPVIGADNSSIPEVIGRADALFNAHSQASMTAKIQQCLQDDRFRSELAAHGLEYAKRFSWDESARRALAGFEELGPKDTARPPASGARARLAYVSPMPPEHSGISDYSAELVPALAAHYDIDLVVQQETLDPLPAGAFKQQRSANWFMDHGHEYDRVMYHFGNSAFHEHMFRLMARHPGTVVLHDFFLSGLQAHREFVTAKQPHWTRALYESHGWQAVARRTHATDPTSVILEYPANFEVLRQAAGVVVHSPFSKELAREWYGPGAGSDWALIPHLRVALPLRREEARAELGLQPDDFLVCAFGIMGPTKMNDRLVQAWRQSALGKDRQCKLVFVGEAHPGEYGREVAAQIAECEQRVSISGWASTDDFRRYLNAADVAVQLRTLSRGETSGTVLDAMNHALPVIANANGSMAYLPREAVLVLDEEFTDEQLAQALETLRNDPQLRRSMGDAGRHLIETAHSPADCAASYAAALDAFADKGPWHARSKLMAALAEVLTATSDDPLLAHLAPAIAHNFPEPRPARQLLVDVTRWALPKEDALPPFPSLVRGLVEQSFPGWRVEPVYRDEHGQWRYARALMLRQLSCPVHLFADDPLDARPQDIWCTFEGGDMEGPPDLAAQLGIPHMRIAGEGEPLRVWRAVAAWSPTGEGQHWYVDISELVRHDWQAGIQRVVKSYLARFLSQPPGGVTVVPVYATSEHAGYRVAETFLAEWAGLPANEGAGRLIAPCANDLLFLLDLQPHIVPYQQDWIDRQRERGVRVAAMVYDLLPVRLAECFAAGATEDHERWLRTVVRSDLIVCISQAVADDVEAWIADHPQALADGRMPAVQAVHLGADLANSIPSRGLPDGAQELAARLREHPSFLMVGTLEPRKGHAAVLAAFERLWAAGSDAQLVIAGRPGWMVDEVVRALREHAERGKRLFWFEDASDELLALLYGACACLIAASRGEGFGLPLVEAAQRGLPVIARDIPVFREVAGEHAFYFGDDSSGGLSASLAQWLDLYRQGRHPASSGMPWLTWAESAHRLEQVLAQLTSRLTA